MSDLHTSPPTWIPPRTTVINGRDIVSDPGLAQLRRYLPVLAVIAAPYAGLGGDQDPLNPLDAAREWRLLAGMVDEAARLLAEGGVPLALVRLVPPTAARLAAALAAGGEDGFQVVHIVCHGQQDMLYLEDENGYESYAVAEHLAALFKPSRARLVVLEGGYSRRIAEVLVEQTGVEAVLGTRRKVPDESALIFNVQLYAALGAGADVRAAYRTALGALAGQQDGQADRYELFARGDQDQLGTSQEITLSLPPEDRRARTPLLAGGQPRLVGMPEPVGFVGRRAELRDLALDMPALDQRLAILHGAAGVGKSWLAAEFAGRFAWRFPGGVLWFRANAQTTAREVISQMARLLELPALSPLDRLLDEMQARCVLLVLDQADQVALQTERDRLGNFIRRIEPGGGCAVLVTTRDLFAPLPQIAGGRAYELGALASKAARVLAMRLAVERDLDALDVDTIDEFLDYTLGLPWMIVKGVELAESHGLEAAVADLADFKPDMPDPMGLYLGRRLKLLATDPGGPAALLYRLRGLPDAIDPDVIEALGGPDALAQVNDLLAYSLLWREGGLVGVPPPVRDLMARHPLPRQESLDHLDEAAIRALARGWPGDPESLPDRKRQARLNNTRALVQRQTRPDSPVDPVPVARLLVAAAPEYRAAGLVEEFMKAAQAIRERLPEGHDLARLQAAMGDALSLIPGRQNEAGWMFQVTLNLPALDHNALAEAHRAYARHLMHVGQAAEAQKVLAGALKALLAHRSADLVLAASLAHDWANSLVAEGRFHDAATRFEVALTGYGRARRTDLAIGAQRDLGEALARSGESDRARHALRQALAHAEEIGARAVSGDLNHRLALLLAGDADQPEGTGSDLAHAESHLNDALADLLPLPDSAALGAVCLDLARLQARLQQPDDAAANAERSRALFEQAHAMPQLAAALVTVGQLRLAGGDAVAAQAALHRALELAADYDDLPVMRQAAGVLVRVYQVRARHAPRADAAFRAETLDQAAYTREALSALGLDDHAAALDQVIRLLSGAG